uniref:Uncharacterized protein n=1 Tax=Solanum tuberosum TaxID=4113 RepID=M1DKI0_SOLTU
MSGSTDRTACSYEKPEVAEIILDRPLSAPLEPLLHCNLRRTTPYSPRVFSDSPKGLNTEARGQTDTPSTDMQTDGATA